MTEHKIDVRYVANLARIQLNDDEVETFQGQLEQIVGYVEKIASLDVAGIEPTSHAHPLSNIFRTDEVKAGLDQETVLLNAPERVEGHFRVPKIVE